MRGWAGQPLLGTQPRRRWAWVLLAACVIVVTALGVTFAHQAAPDGFDRVVDDPVIHSLGRHAALARWMTWPGTKVPAVAGTLVMAGACFRQRRLNGVLLALATDFAATRVDDWFLKDVVHRAYLGALTYPSGHTTSIVSLTAVYVVLFVLSPRERPPGIRLALLALLPVLILSTVLGVVALRWHYFTDTVGGAAVAVGTTCALCLLLDWLWRVPARRAMP